MPKDLSSRQVPTGRSDTKEPKPRTHKSFNVFPALSHKHMTSHRYGDISPFFYFYGTRGDKIPLNTKQEIGTFTMQSPVESDIYANRTYIKVNHQALYPDNWELMRTEKQRGDDVPDHMRMVFNPEYVGALFSKIIVSNINAFVQSAQFTPYVLGSLVSIIRSVFALESIFSQGSLLSMFNLHIVRCSSFQTIYNEYSSFDSWFDSYFVPEFSNFIRSCPGLVKIRLFKTKDNTPNITDLVISLDQESVYVPASGSINLRYCFELMRNQPFTLVFDSEYNSEIYELAKPFLENILPYFTDTYAGEYLEDAKLINIEVVGAYQLACAHFFTDDKIDNVYTSDLWFDAFKHVASSIFSGIYASYYTLNGIKHIYDAFNGQTLKSIFSMIVDNEDFTDADSVDSICNVVRLLFGFRKSLKFGDYYTSARTNLLSGDENEDYKAIVNGDSVSAVSLARSQQYTRFRHQVNLSGSRLSDYLAGILGGPLLDAERDKPQWLAQQSFRIKGYEVENTGTAQAESSPNIISTILKTSNEKFSFKTYVDDQCIILGLQTYDVDRIYANSVDRFAFHFDRYDDFIPQLQFVGDQEIYTKELYGIGNTFVSSELPFAYSERYAEYKRRVSYASGAYISNLPSYAFISDNKEGSYFIPSIDSNFIRSSNVEFDRFFASLTGWSLASYFHFRVKSIHDLTETKRNMVKHPQIFR